MAVSMCDFFAHSLARTKAFHVAKKTTVFLFYFLLSDLHIAHHIASNCHPSHGRFVNFLLKCTEMWMCFIYNATLTGSNRDILSLLKGEPPTQSASREPPCSTMELTVLEIMDLARVRWRPRGFLKCKHGLQKNIVMISTQWKGDRNKMQSCPTTFHYQTASRKIWPKANQNIPNNLRFSCLFAGARDAPLPSLRWNVVWCRAVRALQTAQSLQHKSSRLGDCTAQKRHPFASRIRYWLRLEIREYHKSH